MIQSTQSQLEENYSAIPLIAIKIMFDVYSLTGKSGNAIFVGKMALVCKDCNCKVSLN